MENVMGVKNPTVAIVNIGVEEEKGNALVKETYPMLKECKDINFIGVSKHVISRQERQTSLCVKRLSVM